MSSVISSGLGSCESTIGRTGVSGMEVEGATGAVAGKESGGVGWDEGRSYCDRGLQHIKRGSNQLMQSTKVRFRDS